MENHFYYSERESQRFNMKIFRGNIKEIVPSEIKKLILTKELDILIARIPSDQIEQISSLSKTGFSYIQADTLVYYQLNLNTHEVNGYRNNDLNFEILTQENQPIVDELVEEIFAGYTNHYYSNPYLDKQNIIDGYKEWVQEYMGSDNSKICYLVKKNENIAGFATISTNDNIGEGVLYGVRPDYAGKGIYSDIIRFTQQEFKNKGIKLMKVSTQIQNYTVQKVWVKEGFQLKESFATIHINSLLSYSILPVQTFEISISENDIQKFGEFSGDMNPIHFDDTYAQHLGFNSRIAHGAIINSALSRYFGTSFPGEGTLILGFSYNFFQPIYPNKKYQAKINTILDNKKTHLYEIVVTIRDEFGKICILSRNTLKN